MIFKNGLEDIIDKEKGVIGVPSEMISFRGDVPFAFLLSDALKDKEINSLVELLEVVDELFVKYTGTHLADVKENDWGQHRAYSEKIAKMPNGEGMTSGEISADLWIGDDPRALKFIAENYGVEE